MTLKDAINILWRPSILITRTKPVDQTLHWTEQDHDWQAVSKLCDGYDSQNILKRCEASMLKVKKGEAAFERDGVPFPQIEHNWSLLACLLRIANESSEPICVLDFGGSLGSTYYQCRHFLKNIPDITWCVVEQQKFVDSGKKNFENSHLKFFYTLEECLDIHSPQVLLVSGVLAYMEDYNLWIKKFIGTGIEYLLFDRVGFIDGTQAVLTLQRVPETIYKASYPCWFFNEVSFKKSLSSKYELLADFKSTVDGDYKDNAGKRLYWKGFLFQKYVT